MNASDPNELFRMLLVEDNSVLNWGLTQHILRTFKGVTVLRAETVEDALKQIDSCETSALDVALQDIRVPRRAGEADVASVDVTNRLKALGVRSLFMTGYGASDDVKSFIQHQRLTDPQIAIILKNDVSALKDNVLNQLRSLFIDIASRRISERLTNLFHTSEQFTTTHTGTASLLTLTRDIARYWSYLDEATKKRVLARFDVRLSDQGVDNVLLTPAGPN